MVSFSKLYLICIGHPPQNQKYHKTLWTAVVLLSQFDWYQNLTQNRQRSEAFVTNTLKTMDEFNFYLWIMISYIILPGCERTLTQVSYKVLCNSRIKYFARTEYYTVCNIWSPWSWCSAFLSQRWPFPTSRWFPVEVSRSPWQRVDWWCPQLVTEDQVADSAKGRGSKRKITSKIRSDGNPRENEDREIVIWLLVENLVEANINARKLTPGS